MQASPLGSCANSFREEFTVVEEERPRTTRLYPRLRPVFTFAEQLKQSRVVYPSLYCW
jgi:hypothetical protein